MADTSQKNILFIADDTGRMAYYPFGAFTRGYYVDTPAQIEQVSKWRRTRFLLSMVFFILLGLFIHIYFKLSLSLSFAVFLVLTYLWMYLMTKKIVAGLTRTKQRLSLKKSNQLMLQRFSLRRLMFLEFCMAYFFIVSLVGEPFQPQYKPDRLFLQILFGVFFLYYGFLLIQKWRGK